ncbi:unnamed protein product, partial [Symbiodinium sp. CCMP2592]
ARRRARGGGGLLEPFGCRGGGQEGGQEERAGHLVSSGWAGSTEEGREEGDWGKGEEQVEATATCAEGAEGEERGDEANAKEAGSARLPATEGCWTEGYWSQGCWSQGCWTQGCSGGSAAEGFVCPLEMEAKRQGGDWPGWLWLYRRRE